MKNLNTLLLLLFTLISFSEVYAQDTKKKEKIGPSFRATLFNTWNGPQLYVLEKKAYIPINPAKYSYSSNYRFKEGIIQLFEKYTSPEGEDSYKPIISLAVPSNINEPLIVLFWNNKTKKALAKAIEFSTKKFKFGTYQVVNFSNKTIIGYIGNKTNKVICKPNSSFITPFNFKKRAPIPIVFYTQINNKLKKVFGSITIHKERKRAIYLMYGELNKLKKVVYQGTVIVDFKNTVSPQ